MNDTTCAPRIATLEAKIIQLDARRTELADLISTEPTAPGADVLDALRRRIRDVIASGTTAQRKELIEAMVAAIRIDGDTVYSDLPSPTRRRNPRRHKLDRGRRVTVSHNGAVGGPPGTRTPNLWIKSPQLCH